MRRLVALLRGTGRDPSQATLAVRGTVALAVVAVVVTGLVLVGRGTFHGDLAVTAVVADAGGSLVDGADVKLDGVVVGRVTGVRLGAGGTADPDAGVEIDVLVDPRFAEDVPGDVLARVLPASVFGISFLELVRPGDTGPQTRRAGGRTVAAATGGRGTRGEGLQEGQVIPADTSQQTLEFQAVLDSVDRVVGDLGPAQLSRTLDGLATALDGNGEKLGRTLVTLRRYLAKLNPRWPLLRRNLDLLATNLEAFEGYAPDLFDAVDDTLVAARTIADQETDFRGLAVEGSRTLDATTTLVDANAVDVADLLARTATVVDVLHDGRSGVVEGLLDAIDLGRNFTEAMAYGRFLRTDGRLVLQQSPAYGPEDCPVYGSGRDAVRGRGC